MNVFLVSQYANETLSRRQSLLQVGMQPVDAIADIEFEPKLGPDAPAILQPRTFYYVTSTEGYEILQLVEHLLTLKWNIFDLSCVVIMARVALTKM